MFLVWPPQKPINSTNTSTTSHMFAACKFRCPADLGPARKKPNNVGRSFFANMPSNLYVKISISRWRPVNNKLPPTQLNDGECCKEICLASLRHWLCLSDTPWSSLLWLLANSICTFIHRSSYLYSIQLLLFADTRLPCQADQNHF